MMTLGHFVLSLRERQTRDSREMKKEERSKGKANDSEETEEIKKRSNYSQARVI